MYSPMIRTMSACCFTSWAKSEATLYCRTSRALENSPVVWKAGKQAAENSAFLPGADFRRILPRLVSTSTDSYFYLPFVFTSCDTCTCPPGAPIPITVNR
jgi:hypothetical protein